MARIGRLPEAATLSFILLLILCFEQTAQSRSAPLLTNPASPPEPAVTDDLQTKARQIIFDGLADPSPQIRANAVEVVATTRDIRLMPKVQSLLADKVIPVRFAAAMAVGDLEYALARDSVAGMLNDLNPNVRIAASYAMFRLGGPEHYETLRKSLDSQDQTVRANAALLLGKCGRQEAIEPLYGTLRRNDSSDKVVAQAVEALAMLKDARIYSLLWTRLISAYVEDRVSGIRGMVALGTADARNAVVTMLDDPVPEVRLVAAGQLGKLGDPIGQPEVLAIMEKNFASSTPQGRPQVKMLTALAIGEIGVPALTKHLPSLLKDKSKVVRLAAAKAILRSASRDLLP